MESAGYCYALLAGLCWAISAFPLTIAGRAMSVSSMNIARLVAGTLLVMIVAILSDKNFVEIFSSRYLQGWLWLGLSGLTALGIGDYFSYRMYAILGPRNGSALAAISPAATLLFGLIFLNEHINLTGIAGMLITMTGVIGLSLGRSERAALPDHGHGSLLSGMAFGIIGSVCNGAGIVFSKKAFVSQALAGSVIQPLTASFIRFFTAMIVVTVVTCLNRKPFSIWKNIESQSRSIHLAAIFGIIFGPLLGVGFALTAIQHIDVAVAQTIFALVPAIALLISNIVYKEKITKAAVAGVFLATAGVFLLIWRINITAWLTNQGLLINS